MSHIVRSNTVKNGVEWIGTHISSPEQRLLMGATALAIQPVIDYKNKNVDEDTRMISVARTLGKIIAGTMVGVAIRYGCIGTAKKFSKCIVIPNPTSGLIETIKRKDNGQIFAPVFEKMDNIVGKLTPEQFSHKLNNHITAVGTIIGTLVGLFTNFAVDAPLTRYLTKKFHAHIKQNPELYKKEDKRI